jgi:hypothetical protein
MCLGIYKGVISGLLILNIILIFQVLHLKQSPSILSSSAISVDDYMKRPKVPNVTVLDSSGQANPILNLLDSLNPVMFVFFSPSDCPSCFEERRLWSAVNRSGLVRVYGIACHADPVEFWNWVRQTGFEIPLFLDTSYVIIDSMSFRTTPLKTLVDQQGRVLWCDLPRIDNQSIRQFWKEFPNVCARTD